MTITRKDRGELLYSPEISKRTGMPAGTIRSKYQRGEMTCVWKLGRWLVAWETDLDAWLDEQRDRTVKTRGGDDALDEAGAVLDGYPATVEARGARVAVSTVHAHGLVIRVDASGNAVSVHSPDGFEITEYQKVVA